MTWRPAWLCRWLGHEYMVILERNKDGSIKRPAIVHWECHLCLHRLPDTKLNQVCHSKD